MSLAFPSTGSPGKGRVTAEATTSAVSPPGETQPKGNKKPFYTALWFQVLVAMTLAVVFGYFSPAKAVAMKPLGDAFIRLIAMVITVLIFCTVVSGIGGMDNLRKVGRVGGKAILYFEVVSTLALLVGLLVGTFVRTGDGFNANPATLDA